LAAGLLVSCAPVAYLRPTAGALPVADFELGAGVAAVGPRPYVTETWRGTAQTWLSHRHSELVTLSALAAFDDTALALGGAIRLNAFDLALVTGGVEAEAGYAWAALALPLTIRVHDRARLYTAPRLATWSLDPLFGVPLGVGLDVHERVQLLAEAQLSWQDFKSYNRRIHAASALAYRF
jgi:hypothetical protein